MLHVTGHKVAKTLRGLIPTLAILLWTPQAPPESQSSEASYTFPFQQKAVSLMWPDISHLCFCLKQRKVGLVLFCSVLSPNRVITHFWVNFNKSSAELQLWHKEKQGQGGCRIMMCHPTSSWKWFCTGHKEIEMGDFVNPSTEQQDCVLWLVMLQALRCSPGEGISQWGNSVRLGRRGLSSAELWVSREPFKGHPSELISNLPSAVARKHIRIKLSVVLSCCFLGNQKTESLLEVWEGSQFSGDLPGDQNQHLPKLVISLSIQWRWASLQPRGIRHCSLLRVSPGTAWGLLHNSASSWG